jgi:hypothetical protein
MDDTEITIESFNTPEMYAKEAQAVFLENARAAAQELVDLALHGATERVRMDAAKYVVDRVLGRIEVRLPAGSKDGEGKDPWSDLFGTVIREPTATERARGRRPS